MNRNAVIFVVASMAILFGWPVMMEKLHLVPPPAAEAPATPGTAATAAAAPAAATTAVPVAAAPAPAVHAKAELRNAPEQTVAVVTDKYDISLSSWGARFNSLKLKGVLFKDKQDKESVLDLVPSTDELRFGALELPGADLSAAAWTLVTKKPVSEGDVQVVRFALALPSGLEIQKAFRFPHDGTRFSVQVNLVNRGRQVLNPGSLALLWGPNLGGDDAGIGRFPVAGVVQQEGKIEREKAAKESSVLGYSDPKWVALKNHYFVIGSFPAGGPWNKAEIRQLGADKVVTALVADNLSLTPGQSVQLSADVYAGAQEYDSLKKVGKNFQAVVQFQFYKLFDWLNPVSIGLLHVLKWLHKVTGNWGIAIIILTLLVRGLMFWPSLKSMVSMRRMQTKMAAMQPRLETIKKVYKDDPNKLNAEMMKLYKEYGVNPLGGCLPMLLQIPVFFALYGTLGAAFELRGAAFIWRWTDLTAGDPTYIFPVAMGVSMFLQQKLSPQSASVSDEQVQMQKMMLWLMPIMFGGMAVFMKWPVGLLLYWTASNVFGIVQQLAVNKAVD